MELQEPYYAVIFTNAHTDNTEGYTEMANEMVRLAKTQKGFIDFETARDGIGISVSYWRSLADIANWKNHVDHTLAQRKGINDWYAWYKVRICKVEREYAFNRDAQ